MKKVVLILITAFIGLGAVAQNDDVIMTINDTEITKSDFLQIYLKNNNDPKYDKESLDEYMDLFKKFKLKVAEAEAMGYDTIPKLVNELNGYRKQLALPYLIDSAKNVALVEEAYERTKTEVRASHILIRVDPNAAPADTLRAYNQLLALKQRIEDGEDFKSVAMGKGGSEDPSASSNGGDLGYFTAFQMVYPFEDMAYKTPVGKISDPFRTRFGYHILKVTDKRPARGTIQTAHIMVSASKTARKDEIQKAEDKINEIYEQLKAGKKFEDLVRNFSDDPSTNTKDGKLPVFGTGATTRMVPEFEEAAFALKNNGDFSKPIRTDYGFHIIKRIELYPVPSFEELKKELEAKVAKDVRSKQTQSSFVAKLKKEYKYKDKRSKGIKYFNDILDSTYFNGMFNAADVKNETMMFSLDGKNYTTKDFAKYLEKNFRSARRGSEISEVIDNQYNKWEKEAILAYEESKLASKYPAFKALITEYHDGILLYEIMSDMVWNKAMRDTTGLKNFYEENKADYQWGERIDADIYECYSQASADMVQKMLKIDTVSPKMILDTINMNSELNLRHRSGKFDTEKTRFIKDQNLKEGVNKTFENDGKYFVIDVKKVIPPGQKEFDEAKGAVTSDYQNYLEQTWLKELEQKHKVVVNTDVLYSLGK